jgi:GDP-L-fucose synthase
MEKTAPILVTGHTGMVGRNVVDALKKAEWTNLLLPTSTELDLLDQQAVQMYMEAQKPKAILHLAARVGGIMANIEQPAVFLYENVVMSTNIMEAARAHGTETFINLGSSCIYPRECPQPMKEEMLLTGTPEPTNEGYAIAKIVGVKLCEQYHKQHGMNAFSLIAPNLYGTHERFDANHSHVIAGLIMKFHAAKEEGQESIALWGTGKARREFLFVKDIADALVFALENITADQLERTYVNIGSGDDISIHDLAQLIAKTVGYKGEITWDTAKPDGMPQKLMDVSRMKKLGWQPQISLDDGIKETYAYYQTIAS